MGQLKKNAAGQAPINTLRGWREMSADTLPYCPPSTAPDPLETEVAQARKLVLRALDAKIAIQDDATALGAIRLALKLAGNILEHPDEGKYTRIKNSSAAFQRCLAKCPGGLELVMAMGFRTAVHEFEEFWAVEVSPLALSILAAAREGLARYESLVVGRAERAQQALSSPGLSEPSRNLPPCRRAERAQRARLEKVTGSSEQRDRVRTSSNVVCHAL